MVDSISLQQARRQLTALTTDPGYDQADPAVIAAIAALRILLGDTSTITKSPCVVATTANVALTGNQTIDGFAVPAGSRVLVDAQAAAKDNGIYVTAAGAWARAEDFADWSEIVGTITTVERGT